MNVDWKHVLAVVLGIGLSLASTQIPGFKDAVCSSGAVSAVGAAQGK